MLSCCPRGNTDRLRVSTVLKFSVPGWPATSAKPTSSISCFFPKHQPTNSVAEGLNSKIHGVIKIARWFRNLEHFKVAIPFHCGGLALYPH